MTIVGRGLTGRLRRVLPERELAVRAGSENRVVRLGTRHQLALFGTFGAALLTLAGGGAALAVSHSRLEAGEAELAAREAALARTSAAIASQRTSTAQTLDALSERQRFLETMWDSLPRTEAATTGELSSEEPNSDGAEGTAPLRVSAATSGKNRADALAERQLRFADRLARYADARATRAEHALARLGLSPLAAQRLAGTGGPFEAWNTGTTGDPLAERRLERLGRSLARLDGAEAMLARLPQVSPASGAVTTSVFGYRRDPFTGAAALHKGLDFAGPIGTPIRAAAAGRVSFAGQKGGYGNVVEVTHANGIMTRYAHLSGFAVRTGAQVDAGAHIGALGNSGRSTGPHLHFEVHLAGRPVNPRPFLETARNVLEEVRLPAGHPLHGR